MAITGEWNSSLKFTFALKIVASDNAEAQLNGLFDSWKSHVLFLRNHHFKFLTIESSPKNVTS